MNHFTVYKVTNLIDGKIYIGKHECKCDPCKYMGSGKRLRRAIAKHGIKNFVKEILFSFDTQAEMNAKEAELVTEEFINRSDTYNLCPGGQGGFGYINDNGLNGLTLESRIRGGRNSKYNHDIKRDESVWGPSLKKAQEAKGFKGKNHTEEWKTKHSLIMHGKYTGERSSQFGTMWITNGTENRKIKKEQDCPEGWFKGRK